MWIAANKKHVEKKLKKWEQNSIWWYFMWIKAKLRDENSNKIPLKAKRYDGTTLDLLNNWKTNLQLSSANTEKKQHIHRIITNE